MGKINNLILFSEYFNVSRDILEGRGVFDPIINLDTHLFIDPLLLKNSKHSQIRQDAVKEYNDYFSGIAELLSLALENNDEYFKESAYKQLPSKEIDGTCLGFGLNSIAGRAIPEKVRKSIINTASKIVKAGIKDPELFALLPLFNSGIGPDMISDLATYAIHKTLIKFSADQAKELGIPLEKIEIEGEDYNVIANPLRHNSYILLLPTDILRELPVVRTWKDISKASSFNSSLRRRVNKYVSSIFKNHRKNNTVIEALLNDTNVITDLIAVIKGMSTTPYDLRNDNERLVFISRARELIAAIPVKKQSFNCDLQGLNKLVETIIEHFKFMIECKGLNSLLWKGDKKGRCAERVPQLLFYMIAWTYCHANDIDVNPEVDTGSGLIDFKFSVGFTHKIIVELKYSDNHKLLSGLNNQLPKYIESEKANIGHYVILDVGEIGKKLEKLEDIRNDLSTECYIHYIDAKIKPTASKL